MGQTTYPKRRRRRNRSDALVEWKNRSVRSKKNQELLLTSGKNQIY